MNCNGTVNIRIEYTDGKLLAPNPDVVCLPNKRPKTVMFSFQSDVPDIEATITQSSHRSSIDTAFKNLTPVFTVPYNGTREDELKDGNFISHQIYKYTIEADGKKIDPVIIIEPTLVHNLTGLLLGSLVLVSSLVTFVGLKLWARE